MTGQFFMLVYNFQIFPIAYVLMSKKTTACCIAVFEYIEANLFHLEPVEFMVDFEKGLRKCLNKVYPNSIIRGCWYHYCAAFRKKSRKLGMTPLMNINADAKVILKELMSLPLLPSDKFEMGYVQVKQMTEACHLKNEFKALFSYFDSFWLRQVMMQIQ